MKLTTIILFVSTMMVSASLYSQNTHLTLNFPNISYDELFQRIEEQSEFRFAFSSSNFNPGQKVEVKVAEETLEGILNKILPDDVSYEIIDRYVVICNSENESVSFNLRESKTISGRVSDSSGQPLPGVTIVVKGTANGVISEADGSFTLVNIPDNAILQFSFIGMQPQEIAVAGQKYISVVMKEDVIGLEEVVAVGYGVQKKKLTTGSTVQVRGDDVEKLSTVSVLGALQSQSPGVNITQSSGMPGEAFKVTVRGLGTTGDSSPLYVIDGVAGGDINNLSPSDIESVDVLKDAASAAIYGARAANGVILVTTKQGESGKMQFSYDGYYGVQNVYKMAPILDATEYMAIMNEINFNEGLDPYNFETLIPDLYQRVASGEWSGTNWLEEIRNKNAPIQNHSFNLFGGNDVSKFSSGFSYSNQQGILGVPVEPNFKRYTVRLNSDHILYKSSKGVDVIKIGQNLNFNYNEKRGIGIGNMYWNDIHNMLGACPLMPVYDDEGNYFDCTDSEETGLINFEDFENPIASMVYNRGQNKSRNYTLQANAYIEIQPVKSLIFKSRFGFKLSAGNYRSYTPAYELSLTDINTTDDISQSLWAGHSWTWENTVSYLFNLDNHSFTALIGQSLEKSGMGDNLSVADDYSLFSDFDHAYIDNAQGLKFNSVGTSISGSPWGDNSIESFFGRVLYNYNETYMASVIMRVDGSSNFMKGNRWGYFPSVSAGWVVTNENFMGFTKNWLDFLKVRASWGQNGNCSISSFQYLATISFDSSSAYSFGNSKDSQSTGGYADILPNEDITWETSEQFDIGFDARFLNMKLGVAFDLYNKTTKDWLVVAPILASYGTNAPYINGGDVENKGVEIGLNWNDKVGEFNYGVNLNIAGNKNKVTRIANGEGIIHGSTNVLSYGTDEMYRAEVGKPIGYFWGFETNGVFQNQAQIEETEAILQTDPQPGDLIFADTNNDGSITEDDKVEIGNPHPDLTLGFSFYADYKGFDFSVTASGAFGHQIAKSYRSFGNSRYENYTTEIFDRWHGEGTSNTLPRLTSGSHTNWLEISDIYIENGDYLKIQNLTVGYDFKNVFNDLPFSQLRLYLTGQNIFTFTKYSGMDPEVGYGYDQGWVSGIDLGFYPSARTYLLGVNVKF